MSISVVGRSAESKNIYRFGFFFLAVAVGVTTLSGRMFQLQLLEGQTANQVADTQPTTTVTVPSTRGLIFDANNQPLVKNITTFAVTITPSDLPLPSKQDVADKLASLLKMDPLAIVTKVDSAQGSRYQPVQIADNIDAQVARFIEENSAALPGVKIAVISKRQYLTKELFAQLLGYEGRITKSQLDVVVPPGTMKDSERAALLTTLGYSVDDVVGQAGLENEYEQVLRGTYGTQKVSLDAAGKPIPGLAAPAEGTVTGSSLTLNIDSKEQALLQEALSWAMSNAGIQQGAMIVENPQNGKILAMVSLPSYNDQLFADGISQTDFQKLLDDKNQPLLNKAISQYAPGSTYKLVTATAGISGVPALSGNPAVPPAITPTDTLVSKPYITAVDQPDAQQFKEWDGKGWGPLNVTQAISYSSDTFFYQLARKVGIDNLAYWAHQYGFASETGVDLPGEAPGTVLSTAWKKENFNEGIYTGEVYLAGIGQGFIATTPLQILNAYCALANGGNLWTPQIVKSITDPSGAVDEIQPKLINRLSITPENLAVLRQGMRDVVTTGHTGTLKDLPITISGKTGTAEFGVRDRAGNLPFHEWFVGWVPADPYSTDISKSDSQLAVIAFMYGANTRGNVAVEAVRYYLWKHFKLKGDVLDRYQLGGVLWYSLKKGLFYGN